MVLYQEEARPSKDDKVPLVCCGGTGFVKDNRFGDVYKCPVCNKGE